MQHQKFQKIFEMCLFLCYYLRTIVEAYNSCGQVAARGRRTRLEVISIDTRINKSCFWKVCLCETHDQSAVGEFEIQLNWWWPPLRKQAINSDWITLPTLDEVRAVAVALRKPAARKDRGRGLGICSVQTSEGYSPTVYT